MASSQEESYQRRVRDEEDDEDENDTKYNGLKRVPAPWGRQDSRDKRSNANVSRSSTTGKLFDPTSSSSASALSRNTEKRKKPQNWESSAAPGWKEDRRVLVFTNQRASTSGNSYRDARRKEGEKESVNRDREEGIGGEEAKEVFKGAKNERARRPAPKAAPVALEAETEREKDARISRQLRRLMKEDKSETFLQTCHQLEESLVLAENRQYLYRQSEFVLESLYSVLKSAPGPTARKAALKIMAILGQRLSNNEEAFRMYLDWIMDQYHNESNTNLALSLMNVLGLIMEMDPNQPRSKAVQKVFMSGLINSLENADQAEYFLAGLEPILLLVKRAPDAFRIHFRDAVDMLVGWQLDPSQPPKVRHRTLGALKELETFWGEDASFSLTLLMQFLEDIEAYSSLVSHPDSGRSTPEGEAADTKPEDLLPKIASLLQVFCCISQCRGVDKTLQAGSVAWESLVKATAALADLFSVPDGALQQTPHSVLTSLVIAANESCVVLLSFLKDRAVATAPADLYKLIHVQWLRAADYNHDSLVALLKLMTQTVHSMAGKVPSDAILEWFGPQSVVIQHLQKNSFHAKLVQEALNFLNALLNVKHVSLVQEAYKLCVQHMTDAVKLLTEPKEHPICPAKGLVLFLLQGLTVLAKARNSMVATWGLNPSLVQLLAVRLAPLSYIKQHPQVSQAVLNLLYVHSSSHAFFVSTSLLVNPQSDSPSALHLTTILNVLTTCCEKECFAPSLTKLVYQWSKELIAQTTAYSDALVQTSEFQAFITALLSNLGRAKLARCPEFFALLMQMSQLSLEGENLKLLLEIALFLSAVEPQKSSSLLGRLPVCPLQNQMNLESLPYRHIRHVTWSSSRSEPLLNPEMFRQWAAYILAAVPVNENWAELTYYLSHGVSNANFPLALTAAPAAPNFHWWLSVQMGLYCVQNKLRTPLGKPTETFLAIESGLKAMIAGEQKVTLTRAFGLLNWLEALEKYSYNAFEGCAVILPSPVKAVRTFFRTNQNTCKEWLSRIRVPAMLLAQQMGAPAYALRHGLQRLADLLTNSQHESKEFQVVVRNVLNALIELKAPEAVTGLKSWLRSQNCDQFEMWLDAAAKEAAGSYEPAAKQYLNALNNNHLGAEGSTDRVSEGAEAEFLEQHLLRCYSALNNWGEWQAYEKTTSPSLNVVSAHDSGFLNALSHFKEKSFAQSLQVLEDTPPLPPGPGSQLWKAHLEQSTLKIANFVTLQRPDENSVDELAQNRDILQDWAQLSAASHPYDTLAPPMWLLPVQSMLLTMSDARNVNESFHVSAKALLSATQTADSDLEGVLRNLSFAQWAGQMVPNAVTSRSLLPLKLEAAKAARKVACFVKAENLLGLENALEDLNREPNVLHMAVCYEGAQLLKAKQETHKAVQFLARAAWQWCCNHQKLSEGLFSKSILTLAEWVTSLEDTHKCHSIEALQRLLDFGQSIPAPTLDDLADQALKKDVIGQLIRLAVVSHPSLCEAWLAYGNFCYKQGLQTMREGSVVLPESVKQVNSTWSDEQVQMLCSALNNANLDTSEIVTDQDANKGVVRSRAQVKDAVEAVLMPMEEDNGVLSEPLLELWETCEKQRFSALEQAARAYFHYLKLQTTTGCEGVSVTLRLLRVMVRHAPALQPVLEVGLALTPPQPWRDIVPQLLARLGHPEPYVRRRLTELLCRLAREPQGPQLLAYPAVVGAAGLSSCTATPQTDMQRSMLEYLSGALLEEEGVDEDTKEDNDNEEEESREEAAVLQPCYKAMVEALEEQEPALMAHAHLLLKELRRLVLLWDELWLGTLMQQQAHLAKPMAKLQSEIEKIRARQDWSDDKKQCVLQHKWNILFQPVVLSLEALYSVTGGTPETPYENWFQQKYGGTIKSGIERLKKPDWSVNHVVGQSWAPLRQVLGELQKRNEAKSGPGSLLLDQLSPALAKLNGTRLPMPGLKQLGLTITSLGSSVVLLPTKTKPKKLVFCGSDGKKYTYLFKGLEDLHLDERVMQFLSITNALLGKQQNPSLGKSGFRARHYAVVPLGPRSGLIQWVDGTTPLYALYKRWQQRQAQAQQKNPEDKVTVLRPSELFYSKLTPLLQAQGLSPNPDKRSDWPLDALKTVLTSLMEETPSDLLEKEMWCGSSSAGHWWQLTQSYGRSLAVMSVVGYLIGLGDRHLDNVLVDLHSGEIVHIDYNVCFEKGAKLRIPERVPCRLTPNLVRALGPWGVEGLFRSTCHQVMAVLRENEETLLTLLEAFVYDPLVDWTAGHEPGLLHALNPESAVKIRQQRKCMERHLTWTLFAVRLAEMQADWLTNKQDLLACLGELESALETYGLAQKQSESIEDELSFMNKQLQVAQEAQASTAHALHLHATRLPNLQAVAVLENGVKQRLALQLEETKAWQRAYEDLVLKRVGGDASRLGTWMEQTNRPMAGTGFTLVMEFLQGVGQTNFIVQCEDIETRAMEWDKRQRLLQQNVLDLLRPYAEIISLHPPSQMAQHRLPAVTRWLNLLNEDLTTSSCQKVFQEFHQTFGISTPDRVRWALDQQLVLQRTLQQAEGLHKIKKSPSPVVADLPRPEAKFPIGLWQSLEQTLEAAETSLEKGVSLNAVGHLALEASVVQGLLANVDKHDDAVLQSALKAFKAWKDALNATQVLVTSGVGVVSLEAVRRLEAEESSTLAVIESWNRLMLHGPVTLVTMKHEMEANVNAVMQGEPVPYPEMSVTIRDLQHKVGSLMATAGDTPLPPGHVLLMGLDGLYETLQRFLVTAWNAIPWKHVDEVPAKLAPWSNPSTRAVLLNWLMVQRWESMHGLLSACLQLAAAQTGSIAPSRPDESGLKTILDRLQQPLQNFVSEWVQRAGPSMGSWIMHIIVKQLETLNQDDDDDDDGTAVTLNEREDAWEAWRRTLKQAALAEKHARQEVMGHSVMQHVQSHLIAHQWLQQNALMQGGFTAFSPPLRSSLVAELNRMVANLVASMVQLQEIQQSCENVSSVVEQRLKWAAGANPDLNEVLQAYINEQNRWKTDMKMWFTVSQEITDTVQALTHWEVLLGPSPESRALDAVFLQIVNECQEACVVRETCPLPHTPQERAVLERMGRLLEPGGTIAPNWVSKITKEIAGEIKVVKQQVAEKQTELSSAKEALQSQAMALRQVLTQHHRLLSNLRTILKTGAKHESQGYIDRGVTKYLSTYRTFSERCSSIVKLLTLNETSEDKAESRAVQEAEQLLKGLPILTNKIYDDLLSLAPLGQDFKWLDTTSTMKQTPSAPSKVQEERNAVALSIWRRVRLKLEGRDPDPNGKLSVEEQVNDVITEAMNRDNLALLYEGWTPWV